MLLKAFSSQMSWSSTTHDVHNQADVVFGHGGRENHWLRIEAQELSMRHGLMSFPLFKKSEKWKLNIGMHSSTKVMKYQAAVREHPRRARDGVQIAILESSEKYPH